MASSSKCNHFQSPTPNFFKVILPQTLTKRKLAVPLNFVKNHGEALQTDAVCLKVASGAQWKVGLEKNNDKVWFVKGWDEFVKFYSIKSCYFLTFRYDGNFCFYVVIFDKSCLEIQYPMIPIKREIQDFEDKNNLDSKKKSRSKGKSSHPILASSSYGRRGDCEEDRLIEDDVFWFENDFEDEEMLNNKKRSRRKDKIPQTLPSRAKKTKRKGKTQVCLRNDYQVAMATNLASMAINPYDHPSFSITMGPSYIRTDTGRSYLNIPIAFARIYLKESQEITLQVSDGWVWRIWCGVRSLEERIKVEMRDGWRTFATDNNLKVGDICVFELMETTPRISFKVNIS